MAMLKQMMSALQSPSPRRAWIEISFQRAQAALQLSPSPRRAWIEMPMNGNKIWLSGVALPTEGVD